MPSSLCSSLCQSSCCLYVYYGCMDVVSKVIGTCTIVCCSSMRNSQKSVSRYERGQGSSLHHAAHILVILSLTSTLGRGWTAEHRRDRKTERVRGERRRDVGMRGAFSCRSRVRLVCGCVAWCGGEWRGCGFCAFHCFHKSNEEGESSEWLI